MKQHGDKKEESGEKQFFSLKELRRTLHDVKAQDARAPRYVTTAGAGTTPHTERTPPPS